MKVKASWFQVEMLRNLILKNSAPSIYIYHKNLSAEWFHKTPDEPNPTVVIEKNNFTEQRKASLNFRNKPKIFSIDEYKQELRVTLQTL